MHRIFVCFAALAALSACTYPVDTDVQPSPPPITAYSAKVSGKWALLVDTEKASINPQAVGTRCSQFDYHADLSDSFERTSTVEFSRVADDIRPLDHPLSRAELASAGYTGVIALRISDLRADVKVPDLFGGQADASATIAGTITVTLGDQRLVDSSQLARGEAEREAGIACGGAAEALAAASNDAVQDLARKLAEQFANSHAVRNAMTPGLTP